MKTWVVASVGLLTLLCLLSQPAPCDGQVWEQLVGLIVTKLANLWHDGEMDFMGHPCRYSRRPTIYRWQLHYKGKMWCPGWAPFSGSSKTKSKSGAVEHAVRDFVQQAFKRGLITEDDASAWINE